MTQIYVLDAGGQYCHLIARKIRELGVYTEIKPIDTPAAELRRAQPRGLIISGGPHSVLMETSPKVDRAIYDLGVPILGICYGHQLIAHDFAGRVEPGTSTEYGLGELWRTESPGDDPSPLFASTPERQRVWMSHGDSVIELPDGFTALGQTDDCKIAAFSSKARRIHGVQFHPEVVHTEHGTTILRNFALGICGAVSDWNDRDHVARLTRALEATVGDRHVFFLVSGGIDSTVAFLLAYRALPRGQVQGLYVDTGFMRKDETADVQRVFSTLGVDRESFRVTDQSERFLRRLARVADPEEKRRIIGRLFVEIQNEEFASRRAGGGEWLLGQGTIYPDTIESGGTALASKIKTHHNRVPEIADLIAAGKVLEPLAELYKDEVRAVGRALGLPDRIIQKHPFPGPGLAIRCLCVEDARGLERPHAEVAGLCAEFGVRPWLIPVRTVGVQGDGRTYSYMVALEGVRDLAGAGEIGRRITNRVGQVNRVVVVLDAKRPFADLTLHEAYLDRARLDLLRDADAAVLDALRRFGRYDEVWQFPVGLLPLGRADGLGDSVLLRPVTSRDGMTARHAIVKDDVLGEIRGTLAGDERIVAVLYDVTDKPPATIELE